MSHGIKLQVLRVHAMNLYVGAVINDKTLCNKLVITIVKAGLVLRLGYVPEKRRANRTENSHLELYFWGVRGLIVLFYVVHITSGHMDLSSVRIMYILYI
jgi:hypothetical protein